MDRMPILQEIAKITSDFVTLMKSLNLPSHGTPLNPTPLTDVEKVTLMFSDLYTKTPANVQVEFYNTSLMHYIEGVCKVDQYYFLEPKIPYTAERETYKDATMLTAQRIKDAFPHPFAMNVF